MKKKRSQQKLNTIIDRIWAGIKSCKPIILRQYLFLGFSSELRRIELIELTLMKLIFSAQLYGIYCLCSNSYALKWIECLLSPLQINTQISAGQWTGSSVLTATRKSFMLKCLSSGIRMPFNSHCYRQIMHRIYQIRATIVLMLIKIIYKSTSFVRFENKSVIDRHFSWISTRNQRNLCIQMKYWLSKRYET